MVKSTLHDLEVFVAVAVIINKNIKAQCTDLWLLSYGTDRDRLSCL